MRNKILMLLILVVLVATGCGEYTTSEDVVKETISDNKVKSEEPVVDDLVLQESISTPTSAPLGSCQSGIPIITEGEVLDEDKVYINIDGDTFTFPETVNEFTDKLNYPDSLSLESVVEPYYSTTVWFDVSGNTEFTAFITNPLNEELTLSDAVVDCVDIYLQEDSMVSLLGVDVFNDTTEQELVKVIGEPTYVAEDYTVKILGYQFNYGTVDFFVDVDTKCIYAIYLTAVNVEGQALAYPYEY